MCKFFGPKIRSCKFFDKSQVWGWVSSTWFLSSGKLRSIFGNDDLPRWENIGHDWSEIHCVTVARRVNAGDVTSPFVVFENCSGNIIQPSINFIFSVLSTWLITLHHSRQILILHKFWRRQALKPKIPTCRLAPPIFAPFWLWSSHNLWKCDC